MVFCQKLCGICSQIHFLRMRMVLHSLREKKIKLPLKKHMLNKLFQCTLSYEIFYSVKQNLYT